MRGPELSEEEARETVGQDILCPEPFGGHQNSVHGDSHPPAFEVVPTVAIRGFQFLFVIVVENDSLCDNETGNPYDDLITYKVASGHHGKWPCDSVSCHVFQSSIVCLPEGRLNPAGFLGNQPFSGNLRLWLISGI